MAGCLGLALLACGGHGGEGQAPATSAGPKGRSDAVAGVPAIDLERRLSQAAAQVPLGNRNIFDFGPPPTTLPPLPPLSVKYVGSVEQRGIRVAMFLNDKKEMLTGQAGQVVANRFRVVKIGLESVDIQEVGSEQVRRIPLRGN